MPSGDRFLLLRRPWVILATAIGVALIGWGLFHPEFRPDPTVISPAVHRELAKTGFGQTRGISAARFETARSMDSVSEAGILEQTILPIDVLITEKWSVSRAARSLDEVRGLYVGPITVVRFDRTQPPIVGSLLPYSFWGSTRLSRFIVEEAEKFPGMKGGRLRARLTYERRYADGELEQAEDRGLQCDVTNVVDAAAIVPGLSGSAARIECREDLEVGGRRVGPANPQTWSTEGIAYTHWYILDLQWSIPTEGEWTIRFEGKDTIGKWSSKVTSFDRTAQ